MITTHKKKNLLLPVKRDNSMKIILLMESQNEANEKVLIIILRKNSNRYFMPLGFQNLD